MTFPNCPISTQESGKIVVWPKKAALLAIFFINLQSSKLHYHVTTHLREKYAEGFCIFLGNRGNLAGCLTCNNHLALFRVGVLDWRWLWVCGIFEYSSLFSGLKRVRPVFPDVWQMTEKPCLYLRRRRNCSETIHPCKAVSHDTLPRSGRPPLIKKALATHLL